MDLGSSQRDLKLKCQGDLLGMKAKQLCGRIVSVVCPASGRAAGELIPAAMFCVPGHRMACPD